MLNLHLRQVVKSDGGYQNSYCISVIVCRIILTMRTLHCALCLVNALKRAIAAEFATLSTPFLTNAPFVGETFDAIPTVAHQ